MQEKGEQDPTAKERVLLTHEQIRSFSDTLEIPSLETELDRALWQVEQDLELKDKQKKETESIRADAREEKQEKSDDKTSQ